MVCGAGTQLCRRYSATASRSISASNPGSRRRAFSSEAKARRAVHPAVVQGLLAEPVPDQVELAELAVPQGQGEHPLTGIERRSTAPTRATAATSTSVSEPPRKADPRRPAAPAEGDVVVDLAVVAEHPPAVGRDHGLAALGTQLDHRQSAVAEVHTRHRDRPRAPRHPARDGPGCRHGLAPADRGPRRSRRRGRIEAARRCRTPAQPPGPHQPGTPDGSRRRTAAAVPNSPTRRRSADVLAPCGPGRRPTDRGRWPTRCAPAGGLLQVSRPSRPGARRTSSGRRGGGPGRSELREW